MKTRKETNERLKRYQESIRKLDDQLRSQRRSRDTTWQGYNEDSTTKEGESFNKSKYRNIYATPKPNNPTCYHYAKQGHTPNVCMSKFSKTKVTLRFYGYYYNCNKYGHQ